MGSVFRPAANFWASLTLLMLALAAVAFSLVVWLWPHSDYARRVNSAPAQPVPFSHQHHVSGLGIDCRYCHASVEVSSNAGMPPTYACMTCHSQIWTDAALLEPVRNSLKDDRPLVWRRVTDVPDYVYFDHSIHIAKGVGCSSCHGDVASMALTYKAMSLTMQFCLDCHRNPGPRLRPKDKIYDTGWTRDATTPAPELLLAEYGVPQRNLTDCSICHR